MSRRFIRKINDEAHYSSMCPTAISAADTVSTESLSKKRSRCLTTPFLCCRTQVATMKNETRRSVSVRPAGS